MSIAILGGAGAMGGLYGGLLARGGANVTLIDVARAAVDQINAEGIRISEPEGDIVVPVRASTAPAEVGPVDLVIVFVKGPATEAAMRGALPLVGAGSAVVTLQNGWGNAARLASVVGPDRVFGGTTVHSAGLAAPGHVRHTAKGLTTLGEYGRPVSERVRRVATLFNLAGIETQTSDDILKVVWSKLALNCCALPPSALLRFAAGELVQHDGTLDLMREILREVVAVAAKEGISLDANERWESIQGILKRAGGSKASMLQDVEVRKRTEIDTINGAIVAAGRQHGVPTPYNQSVMWLVQSLHETFA